jgi:RHS repeat-associated protein
MPRTSWQQGNYRYGYNGKEKDGDFQSNYDYGFRIYSASIARFLSIDPLTVQFPWWSPYQFAGNLPTAGVDLDGLETVTATGPPRVNLVLEPATMRSVARQAASNAATNGGARSAYGTVPPVSSAPQYMQNQWGERIYFAAPVFRVEPSEIFPTVSKEVYQKTVPTQLVAAGLTPTYYSYDQYKIESSHQKSKKLNFDDLSAEELREVNQRLQNGQADNYDWLVFKWALGLAKETGTSEHGTAIHHFATNKHEKYYTPLFERIAGQYGLSLEGEWNKEEFSTKFHNSKHPDTYHEFVLEGMTRASEYAGPDKNKFLEKFEEYVKNPVRNNPSMLK